MHPVYFSETIVAGKRQYVIDVRESVKGARYLVLREWTTTEEGSNPSGSIMVFEEHADEFSQAMETALQHLKRKLKSAPLSFAAEPQETVFLSNANEP